MVVMPGARKMTFSVLAVTICVRKSSRRSMRIFRFAECSQHHNSSHSVIHSWPPGRVETRDEALMLSPCKATTIGEPCEPN